MTAAVVRWNPVVAAEEFDPVETLAQLAGRPELMRRVAQAFLADCPVKQGRLRTAVERNDAASLRSVAHSLKGAVGNFSARRARAAVVALEQIGAEADMGRAAAALEECEQALAALIAGIEAALEDLGAAG